MDLGPLRALTLSLNWATHGVPATVTRPAPDDTAIATRVIWVTPLTEEVGFDLQRAEPRRIASLQGSKPTRLVLALESALYTLGQFPGKRRITEANICSTL